MCARLARGGFDVTATDLRGEVRGVVDDAGARWAPSISAAAADAELLITMLPGPGEVAAVIGEAVSALAPGACWLEMSSCSPRVASAIADAAGPRGVRVIDAPVGGDPKSAREGTLLVFAGGEVADLERVRRPLDVLADRVVHVGPSGSGYAVKLLVNGLWFTHAVAAAEALAIGRRVGLDLDVLLAAVNESAGSSRFTLSDAGALLDGDDMTDFALARCCEELSSLLALADERGVTLELTSVVADLHRRALERYGDVDGELLGARLAAERAGVDLRRDGRGGRG